MSAALGIAVVRETKKGEKRVALVPSAVKALCGRGFKVFVEGGAGDGAGFSDAEYAEAGAEVVIVPEGDENTMVEGLKLLFADKSLVCRVKRADRSREILEAKALAQVAPGAVLTGFLDPVDRVTPHVEEWRSLDMLSTISLDSLGLESSHPGNALAQMSALTGILAVDDAVTHLAPGLEFKEQTAAILGPGICGQAATKHAVELGFGKVLMVGNRPGHQEVAESNGGTFLQLPADGSEESGPSFLQKQLQGAIVVIAAARRAGTPAPKLIDASVLQVLGKGAVVVDLALTEGGNVVGSKSDSTLTLEGVTVTNVTGYPKREPGKASAAFSSCMEALLADFPWSDVRECSLKQGVVTHRGAQIMA
eukprot:gnl/MRDRNA2_/MRDRNA2_57880_c0_seq1.p1 gnl/MRDRNA2_/MRDRNA2_57880_c0~~gnl/MRDRNA2_/MRDRNA2_57880_c0_seq1.p1  ORF type:complete len:365 (-),score=99.93 gnl/MRDRNA2_/MRDRNA2_57880_c0_seq1:110-1204(-)